MTNSTKLKSIMEEQPQFNDILLYTTSQGKVKIEVLYEDETFWLNQKRIAELFGVEIPTINYHLKEIFKSNELDEVSTIRKFLIVQKEGNREVSREIEFYNLDVVIAVGKVSAEVAKALAIKEYEKFRVIQDQIFESDFDKEVKKLNINT